MTVQEISRVIDGKRVIVKKPELLIPAGNLEKLKSSYPLWGRCCIFRWTRIWSSF